jgi:hypothetical protein
MWEKEGYRREMKGGWELWIENMEKKSEGNK